MFHFSFIVFVIPNTLSKAIYTTDTLTLSIIIITLAITYGVPQPTNRGWHNKVKSFSF